jgi:hypothetical protein
MKGLRSKNSTIIPINQEIERTIRQRPRDNSDIEEEEEEFKEEEPMAEQLVNRPPAMRRSMKHAYIPQNLDQPSCIACQPKVHGTFNLSPHILNTLTHFRGTPNENPHLHIKEFFALCKT